MPRFSEMEGYFVCPYRDSCPYLEGLPARWIWNRCQAAEGLECHYEHLLRQKQQELERTETRNEQLEQENQQLRAQVRALHRRQFKGRRQPRAVAPPQNAPAQPKKRGPPQGHPAWVRPKPEHIDRVVVVPAPTRCPDCHRTNLQRVQQIHEHIQEDIVLEPRTVVTAYQHQQAYCPGCGCNVWEPGPGELPGAYIGPAAKATAIYLRHDLHIPYRKISRLFSEFFGLKFVPASALGFECQAVRRGAPLYEDLRQKIRTLPMVHADETHWRHNGQPYWVWYAGDEDLALFLLDAHRSTQTAQSLLGEKFSGVIVADAYASYKGVHPKDWQSCLAHIKTKAKELDQELALLKGRAADPRARQFCQGVQGWVRQACQAHRPLAKGPWRAGAARNKGRQLRHQLRQLCREPLGNPKAEKFRKRLLGPEQKHLLTCFRRPGVPPTNNQAERSLRPIVIMRKVIQGTRSNKGLDNHSVLRSLFETARRQGRKVHEFFLDLFNKETAQAQAALYRKTPTGKPRPP